MQEKWHTEARCGPSSWGKGLLSSWDGLASSLSARKLTRNESEEWKEGDEAEGSRRQARHDYGIRQRGIRGRDWGEIGGLACLLRRLCRGWMRAPHKYRNGEIMTKKASDDPPKGGCLEIGSPHNARRSRLIRLLTHRCGRRHGALPTSLRASSAAGPSSSVAFVATRPGPGAASREPGAPRLAWASRGPAEPPLSARQLAPTDIAAGEPTQRK